MKVILNILLVCLIAISLILPIGIGAWNGMTNSEQDANNTPSQNEDVDIGLSVSESEVVFNIGATKTLTASTVTE
ncbi:MAG: hypothetical protein IKW53_00515, partial [Clostridia bacterium]|nr:hypothetical protein [Clostridia bacterium]